MFYWVLNNNYMITYQVYLNYFRQNKPFALLPSYQVWCQIFFGENSSSSYSSSLSSVIFKNDGNDLNSFMTEVTIIQKPVCRANHQTGFYNDRDLHHERVNNEANPYTSEIELCFSSESKSNKTKRDHYPKYLKYKISLANVYERLFLYCYKFL